MSPVDWKKIEELFIAVADLSPTEQKTVLDRECYGDDQLRAEVDKLLAGDKNAGAFIETPIWTDSLFNNTHSKQEFSSETETRSETDVNHLVGTRIGAFIIVKEIGRGGMGTVYLAERDDLEFKQKTAIKIIKRGMDSDFIIRRFKHERQILASFEHPNIARLLDGGTTPDGVPYFVMEYIEGETLYNYCDKHCLDLAARIEIFKHIAAAVNYAHTRQIIHRDIKPGNILVNHLGTPKLLDFGIAKILDPDLIHESISPTASMLRMLTPDYASPEHIEGSEVTPESDVYSLGVLFYELLTGHKPYDLTRKNLNELTRIVRNDVPRLPSLSLEQTTNLLSQYQTSKEIARTRNASLDDIADQLKGNLDSIIMKALAKSPTDRYATVDLLLDDLDKHLLGGHISSPNVSLDTRNGVKKFDAKHTEVTKTLAVLPFKFINLGESDDSDTQFIGLGLADALIARMSKVKRLVVRPTGSMLSFNNGQIDPIQAGNDLIVEYILDGNIKKANQRLRVSVQLLDVANNATIWAASIDENTSDVLTLEDALANKLLESLLPQLTSNELEEFVKRGTNIPEAFEHYMRGRYFFNTFTEDGFAQAFVNFHKAIAIDPEYAAAYAGIADYYNWLGIIGVLDPQECFQNAIAAATKAVEIDSSLSDGHASLGFSLHAGNYDCSRAEHHLLTAIDLNPSNANAYVWYSILLFTQMRFEEGFDYAERALDIDPLTPFNHHNIGWGHYFAGDYSKAEKKYKGIIAEFPDYIFGYYGLSKIYRLTGRPTLALRTNARAHELMGRGIFTLLGEAECLAADGQNQLAIQKLRQLTDLGEKRYVSAHGLALAYMYLDENDKALDNLEKAYEAGDPWLNWICVEPVFEPVRSEERFRLLVDKIGYTQTLNKKLLSESRKKADEPNSKRFREQTTELIADTSPTIASATNERHSNAYKYVLFGAMALLVGVFGIYFVAVTYFSKTPVLTGNIVTEPKIVVLPFTTTSSEDTNLGVGLADALTNKLGNIRRLQVISASTGREITNSPLNIVSSEIGANFLVRGKLDQIDDKAVITAELIDLKDGNLVWSGDIAANKNDLFALQSDLAEKIWVSLGIEPQPLEINQVKKSHTESPEAYELYLIGRYLLTKRNANDIRAAITTFGNALNIDPEFAPALVGLADAYALLNLYDTSPPVDGYATAAGYIKKALSIDESLAEAHATNAYLKFYAERDIRGAELDFRRALQLNPSLSQAHHWFALFLAATGKPIEAIQEIETALKLDPRSKLVATAVAMVAFYTGDPEKAIKLSEDVLKSEPSFVPALKVKRWAYSALGDDQAASEVFSNEINYSGGNIVNPGWQIIAAQVNKLGGEKDNAGALLDTAVESDQIDDNIYTYAYEIALAYKYLNNIDKALHFLAIAETHRSYGINFVEVDPRFKDLHSHPKFVEILARIKP